MNRSFLVALSLCTIVPLAACSGSGSQAPATTARDAQASSAPATPAAGTPAPGTSATTAASGDCELLTQAEITEAFKGALTVTRMSGRGARGGGCTVSIAEGEGSQLVVQAGTRDDFEMRKKTYLGQDLKVERLDIGAEAYLINGAQVIAVDAKGQSISLGLTLLVFGKELPVDAATVAGGVRKLGATAIGRL